MSLERARKFCRSCHNYNLIIEDSQGAQGGHRFVTLPSTSTDPARIKPPTFAGLYQARDFATAQAMQAVEKYSFLGPNAPLRLIEGAENKLRQHAHDLLQACEQCDYSSPKIVELTTSAKEEGSGGDR